MVESGLSEFTKRAKEILTTVALADRIKLTDFLNFNEQSALEAMARKMDDVVVLFHGGFESAERCRAAIFPIYVGAESIDIKVSIFKIEIIGSGEVTHSQVLGSLMGLNIDRCVIGDIVVDERGTFFASCGEFDGFLKEHFTKVGARNIRLELIEDVVERKQAFENTEIIVSSMRLDVVVKALIQGSRGKAEAYLDAGSVRLNHVVDKKTSRVCQVGDVLSIRKHGRFKIDQIKKKTKSDKFVLVVSKSV